MERTPGKRGSRHPLARPPTGHGPRRRHAGEQTRIQRGPAWIDDDKRAEPPSTWSACAKHKQTNPHKTKTQQKKNNPRARTGGPKPADIADQRNQPSARTPRPRHPSATVLAPTVTKAQAAAGPAAEAQTNCRRSTASRSTKHPAKAWRRSRPTGCTCRKSPGEPSGRHANGGGPEQDSSTGSRSSSRRRGRCAALGGACLQAMAAESGRPQAASGVNIQ